MSKPVSVPSFFKHQGRWIESGFARADGIAALGLAVKQDGSFQVIGYTANAGMVALSPEYNSFEVGMAAKDAVANIVYDTETFKQAGGIPDPKPDVRPLIGVVPDPTLN